MCNSTAVPDDYEGLVLLTGPGGPLGLPLGQLRRQADADYATYLSRMLIEDLLRERGELADGSYVVDYEVSGNLVMVRCSTHKGLATP